MMNTVTVAAHNGIASYSMTGSGICTGSLVFGVGLRDEPAALAGITHLIEHVLLRMVHPMPLWHGGRVDTDMVEFHATGDGGDVANFLNAIAAAIVSFPAISEQDLRIEKSVVEAENPSAFCRVSSGLLTYRFGTSGPGAGHFGAPSTSGLSRAEVIDWAGRWLTAENAAVTFNGALPDSLDIRLPQGGRIVREHHEPLTMAPTVIRSAKEGVALSLIVPTGSVSFLGEALHYELIDRLSHSSGLIYSVDIDITPVDATRSQLDLILDPVENNIRAAFLKGVAAVRDVAANGFGENAMQRARNTLQVELASEGNGATFAYLDQLAVDRLLGRPTLTPQELLDRAAAMTAKELTTMLQAALASLIVAVDKDAKVGKGDVKALSMALDPYEIWQPGTNAGDEDAHHDSLDRQAMWRHRTSKSVLWLTRTHLWRRKSGNTTSIKLADIVLVGNRSCGCLSLTDSRGRHEELPTEVWKRGKKLKQSLLAAFPVGTVRMFPEK